MSRLGSPGSKQQGSPKQANNSIKTSGSRSSNPESRQGGSKNKCKAKHRNQPSNHTATQLDVLATENRKGNTSL